MGNYYFGQGKVYLAKRTDLGETLGFIFLGNCPELTIVTSRAAQRFAKGGSETETALIPRGDSSMVRFSLDEFADIFQINNILSGSTTSLGGASITDETVIARLGKTVPLAHMNITVTPVVTGMGGAPTYTSGTDYTVNMEHGTLTFPTTSTIADEATVLVDYTYGAYDKISTFTMKPGYFWLRFEGYNIVRTPYSPQIVDCFKVRIRPTANFPIITEDLRILELEASLHYDASQLDDTSVGRLFRIRRYVPA